MCRSTSRIFVILIALFLFLPGAASSATINAQWVASCPFGWTDTKIFDDTDGHRHIGEESDSGAIVRLCIKASDPAVTLTSEWGWNGCSAGHSFTGLYDDAGSSSQSDDLPSYHGLREENYRPNGSNDYRWCIGATGGGATGAEGRWVWWPSSTVGPPCNSDETAVMYARNYVTNLNTGDRSGSNQGTMCIRVVVPVTNGACGATPGTCSAGTVATDNNATACGTTRTWNCNGSGGGSNASCSHVNPVCVVNGACGSPGACSSGTVSGDNGATTCGTTRTWTCNGSGGGSNANCSNANPLCPLNGNCGSSHGGSFYAAPSTNLCALGAPSSVSGSGPYSWTCAGSNGGSTANCSAIKKIDGVCGTANGVGDVNTPTALCSSGNPSGVSAVGTNWNWSCGGINGGTNMNCAAPRIYHGLCGPSNGANVYTAPTSGLCTVGTATSPVGSGPFDWNCNGINGGNNVSCQALLVVNGQCGPADGQYSGSAPTNGLCSAGSAGAVTGTGPYAWSCSGVNGGTAASCSSQAIVNGSCGPSNNTPTASAPVSGLCATGTASTVVGAGPWTWNCTGSGGGSNSNCTAPTPPPPPSFGGACPGP